MWTAVEKKGRGKFSAGWLAFPQVFHSPLWKEKGNRNNDLGRFYTYSQGLLLLLVLIKDLKLIRFRKRENHLALAGGQKHSL